MICGRAGRKCLDIGPQNLMLIDVTKASRQMTSDRYMVHSTNNSVGIANDAIATVTTNNQHIFFKVVKRFIYSKHNLSNCVFKLTILENILLRAAYFDLIDLY